MPLFYLGGPSVQNPVGTILNVTNAMTGSSQGMIWSFEQLDGWFQGARRYTNTLRIITSSAYVGPIQIQQFLLGLGGVQGSYYRFPLPEYSVASGITDTTIVEQDTGSFCQSIELKQESDDGKQWLATYSYGPTNINHDYGTSEVTNGSINPTESAPTVHWSGAIYEVNYPQDINGLPFLNTVGDPLENPPKTEEARQTLSFVRNEATYNENWAQAYRMALNSDPFLGFDPLQAKCRNIQGERIYSSDYGYYWRVSYEFEFRVVTITNSDGSTKTYGFQEIILNAGLRQITSAGKPAQIIIDGAPITNPVALTSDGEPLNSSWQANAAPGTNPDPYFLIFQNYATQPFAFLNIPQDILNTNQ